MSTTNLEEWDAAFTPELRQQIKRNIELQQEIKQNMAWEGKSDPTASDIKSALDGIRAVLVLLDDNDVMRRLLTGHLEEVPSSKLASILALNDFADLRPYCNRKESQGDEVGKKAHLTMRKFWSTLLQPKTVAALDTLAQVPATRLRNHWQRVLSSLRVFERSLTGGDNEPTKEEMSSALQEAATLNAEEDLDALAASCSSPIQTQRSEVLRRVISAANLIGKEWPALLGDLAELGEKAIDIFIRFERESSTLQLWIRGNKEHFASLDTDWFAQAEECERAQSLLERCLQKGKDRQIKTPPTRITTTTTSTSSTRRHSCCCCS